MADASDIQTMLQGFLNKEVYVVITKPVTSDEIKKRLGNHLESQVRLEKEGVMFAAGPLSDEGDDAPVAGMFVLRADSFAEARAIADSDPLHQAGLRDYTIQKWRINEGSFQVTVNFSDQSAEIG